MAFLTAATLVNPRGLLTVDEKALPMARNSVPTTGSRWGQRMGCLAAPPSVLEMAPTRDWTMGLPRVNPMEQLKDQQMEPRLAPHMACPTAAM